MLPGQADYFYPNDQSTRLMWYHDHAHGTTRTNAYAGLATGYSVIDPIQESKLAGKIPILADTVPLVVQDKIFVSTTTSSDDQQWAQSVDGRAQVPGSLWYQHVYNLPLSDYFGAVSIYPLPLPFRLFLSFSVTPCCAMGWFTPIWKFRPRLTAS